MIATIKRLLNNFKIFNILFGILITLFSSFSLLSGYFSGEGKVENISNYITANIKHSTSETIALATNSFENNEIDTQYWRKYCSNQNNLYYDTEPFQSVVSYNSNKQHDLIVSDFPEEEQNITCITLDAFSIHKDTLNRNILDSIYLEVYYQNSNTSFVSEYDNFVYISDIQARFLRDVVWHLPFDPNDEFANVINHALALSQEGHEYNWKIANIFKTDGRLYDSIASVMGSFVISYSYVPNYQNNPFEIVFAFHKSKYLNYNITKNMLNSFKNTEYQYSVIDCFESLSEKASSKIETLINTTKCADTFGYYFFVILSLFVFFGILPFIYFLKHKSIKHKAIAIIEILSLPLAIWLCFYLFSSFVFSNIGIPFQSMVCFFVYYLLSIFMFLLFLLFKIGDKHEKD